MGEWEEWQEAGDFKWAQRIKEKEMKSSDDVVIVLTMVIVLQGSIHQNSSVDFKYV